MPFFHYLRLNNIQHFFNAVRDEGWRAAVRKVRNYIIIHRSGSFLSTISRTSNQRSQAPSASSDNQYLEGIWSEVAQREAFHILHTPSINTKRRKIAMIGDLNLPQCRKYRVEQPLELWQQKNIDYVYGHYQDTPRCVNVMQDATHLMLYRLQNNPLVSMLTYEARRLRLPILYDLDDPLFSISAYETYENMKALPSEMKQHFLNEAPKYLDAMNNSDMITVSTPGMKKHTELYTPRSVYVRRNFADCTTLEVGSLAMNSRHEDTTLFRVAFASGSMGHEIDFAIIQNDIIEFLANGNNRKLMILGHFNLTLLPIELRNQIETYPFTTYDQYLENLAQADCAVMPLANDSFNSCKSAVRVLDASAVAVPSIVGTISDMKNVVDDQRTGFVISDKCSWLPALENMATDRKATKRMGLQARQNLEFIWSAKLDHPIIDPEIVNWVSE